MIFHSCKFKTAKRRIHNYFRKIGWSGRLVFETTEDQIEVFDFLETNYQNLDGKRYLKLAQKAVCLITKTAKGLLQSKFLKKRLLDQKLK